MNKETMLIILRRQLKHMTSTQPDHVRMSTDGMSYTDRQAVLAKREKETREKEKDVEALSTAITFLEENFPTDGIVKNKEPDRDVDHHECG